MKELVFKGENNQAITNSLLVAEKFGKQHKDVLEAIYSILVIAENSAETKYQSITKMFIKSDYDVDLNNGTEATRKATFYIMNRDGFTLLAMGFTGKKAFGFKFDYLNAFNLMEQTLKNMPNYQMQIVEQNIKRRYLLNKELTEVNNSINVLLKRHRDIKTELKTIDDQDFAQLKLFPIHGYVELMNTDTFKHKLKISS